MAHDELSLNSSIAQMRQVERLGRLGRWMGMLPGMRELTHQAGVTERDIAIQILRTRAVYESMSREERSDPDLLNASRRRRIAMGAGVGIGEVSQLLNQFRMNRETAHVIGNPLTRPAGKFGLVLALVTNNRVGRDPSWVHPWIPMRVPAWMLWLALGFLLMLLVAYLVPR